LHFSYFVLHNTLQYILCFFKFLLEIRNILLLLHRIFHYHFLSLISTFSFSSNTLFNSTEIFTFFPLFSTSS
jgi:hypothetical protein